MKRILILAIASIYSICMQANHPAPYMQKGAALISKGNYAKAIKEFDKVIEKFCEYGAAYDYRCYCNARLGNMEEAVTDLVRALRTGNEREKTGELFTMLSLDANEMLVENLIKECKANPYNRNMYYYLGLAYQDGSKDTEAAEAFAESAKEFKGMNVNMTSKAHFRGKESDEFGKWLRSQMTYPEIATANGLEGAVTCSFWIDEAGAVSDVRIIDNVHYAMDSQLVKAIESSPAWSPAMSFGKPVKSIYRFTMNYIIL